MRLQITRIADFLPCPSLINTRNFSKKLKFLDFQQDGQLVQIKVKVEDPEVDFVSCSNIVTGAGNPTWTKAGKLSLLSMGERLAEILPRMSLLSLKTAFQ